MVTFIEAKVRSEQVQSDGSKKHTIDRYLVQADSFTEAEAVIVNSVDTDSIVSVSRSNVKEIIMNDSEGTFYKARVELVSIDEKTMKEKRKAYTIMVEAGDILEALHRVHEGLEGTASDYEIIAVTKTPIVGICGI